MPDQDSITVVIPTHNRRDLLKRTLSKVQEMIGGAASVLVFADACRDGTSEMLRSEFPSVAVMESQVKLGVPGSRNEAFTACKTSYIFSLDDDSWPVDGHIPGLIREMFSCSPRHAFLAANVSDASHPDGAWNAGAKPFAVRNFIGCGFAVRRDVFMGLGRFRNVSLYGGEEMEIALRAYAEGLGTLFVPTLKVCHERTQVNRNEGVELRNGMCSSLSSCLLNEPPLHAALHAVHLGATATLHAARRGHLMAPALGTMDFLGRIPELLRERKPVAHGIFKEWRKLRPCPP